MLIVAKAMKDDFWWRTTIVKLVILDWLRCLDRLSVWISGDVPSGSPGDGAGRRVAMILVLQREFGWAKNVVVGEMKTLDVAISVLLEVENKEGN